MKFENLKQIIVGDYVCTPIKNAFNNKTAYWLSKDGCMLSLYMFTAEECFSQEDFDSRFSDESLAQYITMFEQRCNQVIDNKQYFEFRQKAELYLKNIRGGKTYVDGTMARECSGSLGSVRNKGRSSLSFGSIKGKSKCLRRRYLDFFTESR